MQEVLQYEQESFLNEIWFERRKVHAKKKIMKLILLNAISTEKER